MGINRWEEPSDIMKKIKEISSKSQWDIEDSYYRGNVCEYFSSKCQNSKLEYDRGKDILPDGYSKVGYMNQPFPLVFNGPMGGLVSDIDGNMYINFHRGHGETVLGSRNKKVLKAMKEAMQTYGVGVNLPINEERILAEEIQKNMPYMDKIKFFSGKTEAFMAAIRLARAYTGRKKIIKAGGANHGWYDDLAVGNKIMGSGVFLDTFGINRQAVKYTKEVRLHNINEIKKAISKNVAAVIIEPIGVDNGRVPLDYYFSKELRELCDDKGVVLIFDESETAFRLGNGGVQEYLNIYPDLTVLGDVVGGGMSSAALGGNKEIMEHFSHELPKKKHRAHVEGNQYGNAITARMGQAAIREIVEKEVCQTVADLGDRLADKLNQLIHNMDLPFVVYNQGSIVHLEIMGALNFDVTSKTKIGTLKELNKIKEEFAKRKEKLERLNAAFLCEGLLLTDGTKMFITNQLDEELIDEAVVRFERVFKRLASRKA